MSDKYLSGICHALPPNDRSTQGECLSFRCTLPSVVPFNKRMKEPDIYSLLHLCASLSMRCQNGWKQHQINSRRDANKLPDIISGKSKVQQRGHGWRAATKRLKADGSKPAWQICLLNEIHQAPNNREKPLQCVALRWCHSYASMSRFSKGEQIFNKNALTRWANMSVTGR